MPFDAPVINTTRSRNVIYMRLFYAMEKLWILSDPP
jgi:hypothetical protein